MREIEASGRIVLACRGCGERVVLLGCSDDWLSEGRGTFECGGCGKQLTLADRMGEVDLDFAKLIRGPG